MLDPASAARRRRRPAAVTGLLLLLVATLTGLTGCVRVKVTLTVSADDEVSGRIMAVSRVNDAGDQGPQLQSDVPFGHKVTISRYSRDDFVGTQAVFSGLSFAELPQLANLSADAAGVSLSLRRAGNTVILEGRADLTPLTNPDAEVELSVAFPGEVVDTDGERIGSDTVQWRLVPGAVNTMNAQANYGDPSIRSFIGSALQLGLAGLLAATIIGTLAWQGRDTSPRPGSREAQAGPDAADGPGDMGRGDQ